MVAKNLSLVLLAALALTACQTIPNATDSELLRRNEPQNIELPVTPTKPKSERSHEPEVVVSQKKATKSPELEPAPAPEVVAPSADQVVTRLQLEALQLQSEGRWSDAELKLERALRIDTDKVDLYHQLATVRMGQLRFSEAEQIALKGLTLTDQTPKFKASLWEVIAQCRSGLGDISGARNARAEMLKWMESE